MAQCRKCGLGIRFIQIENYKWMPVNLDGSSHWDACRIVQRAGRAQELMAKHPPIVTNPMNRTEFYTGEVPPWDESLGEWRDSTTA